MLESNIYRNEAGKCYFLGGMGGHKDLTELILNFSHCFKMLDASVRSNEESNVYLIDIPDFFFLRD